MLKVIFYHTHTVISIPYGAIKSNRSNKTFAQFQIFQFLMVRLKALSDTMIRNTNDISIPYGAIKSMPRLAILFI